MNKRLLLGLGLLAVSATVVLLVPQRSAPLAQSPAPDVTTRSTPPPPELAACDFPTGWRHRYQYSSHLEGALRLAQPSGPAVKKDVRSDFEGVLALERLEPQSGSDETVLLGQFVHVSAQATEALGERITAPFLVRVGPGCEWRGFARHHDTPSMAARSQQVTLHDVWLSVPSTPERTTARFENGLGTAQAVFERHGASVVRETLAYDALWSGASSPVQVSSSRLSATLGRAWLERATATEVLTGGPFDSVTLRVELELTGDDGVPTTASRSTTEYVWGNLLPVTQAPAPTTASAAVPTAERRYVQSMQNASLESAFAQLAERVSQKGSLESTWHEMAGFLNGHPEAVPQFIEGLRAPDFPEETKAVSYFVLSKVVHATAREGLVLLRADPKLPPFDRYRAGLALVTRHDVGLAEGVALSRDALEGTQGDSSGQLSRNSLLQLGILAGQHPDDAQVQQLARLTIEQALGNGDADNATTAAALAAMGNLADPSTLPLLRALSANGSIATRTELPHALRHFPYDKVEGVWLEWLRRETNPAVLEQMFDVIRHQLADARHPAGPEVVTLAIAHLKLQPQVLARQSVIHIIGGAVPSSTTAKDALMAQAPIEFRNDSGLYSQIAHYLPNDDVLRALSAMPEFAHQFGGAGQ